MARSAFYAWMTLLTAVCLVGVNAWAQQVTGGMILTHMTDHVSWGLYIANFTFGVGTGGRRSDDGHSRLSLPRSQDARRGDLSANCWPSPPSSSACCSSSVDLGRPDRFWHLIPGIGRFNFPMSMLTWDVIVLNGYLLINLHICGYLLYMRYLGRTPNPRWYVPFVFLSIVWAISIHTVTAFLYQGLGGRPFWNSALLAPRFLASAFVSGPAFLVVTMILLRWLGRVPIPREPIRTLVADHSRGDPDQPADGRVGTLHRVLHGHGPLDARLLPVLRLARPLRARALDLDVDRPQSDRRGNVSAPRCDAQSAACSIVACAAAFVGIWIEKGMGLIIPGFVPSTLHQMVEYQPSLVEWQITAGIWAFGLMVYTVALKIAIPILRGQVNFAIPSKQ